MKFVDFENRVCLVTGAGSPTGIGFSTAKILGGLGGGSPSLLQRIGFMRGWMN